MQIAAQIGEKYGQIKLKLQLYTLQLAEFPAAFA
jgi:hypothetical protein